jgi:IS30 family transposase
MGHNQTTIAKAIGKDKSTICRELQRNKGQRGYRPIQAHNKAMQRRRKAKPQIQAESWVLIEEKLRQDWSPEQITGWMNKHYDETVSHEWIYQYVLADKKAGGTLYKHLRCQKKRRKRYGKYDRRGKISNRISIDRRPSIVDERKRVGDWEIDTVIGKGHRGALVTLTERKSRLALIQKVDNRKSELVTQATISLLKTYSDKVYTITSDNGKEFADHETIARQLDTDFYFAHPYASWERGANENMNGLIRQYFPKNTDFLKKDDHEIELVMAKLNHRPRKCLGFKTPFEVFFNNSVALKS